MFCLVLLALVVAGSLYSHHGFFDLRRLQAQIENARVRAQAVELENQRLKYHVALFDDPSEDLIEREVREFLGWVKSNELVYLEKSSR